MPYEIDPVRRLVIWTHTASEPPGLWTQTLETILADSRFAAGFNIFEDSRDDPDVPGATDIRQGVNTILRHRDALGHCRWAVVLRRNSQAFYGMLRMAEMLLDQTAASVALRPFTDSEEALAWLSDG